MALPYKDSDKDKKSQIEIMFDNIAHRYDLLNHFLSLGIDKLWRKKAINLLKNFQPQYIIDIACGTGDFSIEAVKLNPERIIGIDISEKMLEKADLKVRNKKIDGIISFQKGDSEKLQFDSNTFDASLTGFGVRNFENPLKGLSEIFRVLKPGGRAVILEFSVPENILFRKIYFFYFRHVLPFLGKIISKDNSAYKYLPDSVMEFPCGKAFEEMLKKAGFKNTKAHSLSFGIAIIYVAIK